MSPPHYHSNACRKPRVAPGELPGAIGIAAGPDDSAPIGIAFGAGFIRGDLGRIEATWRLVVRGEAIDGWHALRSGEFVDLAEET